MSTVYGLVRPSSMISGVKGYTDPGSIIFYIILYLLCSIIRADYRQMRDHEKIVRIAIAMKYIVQSQVAPDTSSLTLYVFYLRFFFIYFIFLHKTQK